MKHLLITLLCLATVPAWGQKKALDHDVYNQWQTVENVVLSRDGRFALWQIAPQEGDSLLCVENLQTHAMTSVPRGYRASVTRDGQYAVCLIKPFWKDLRVARGKKLRPDKMPKDSAALISLKDFSVVKVPRVRSFQLPRYGSDLVVMAEDTLAKKSLPTKKDTQSTNAKAPDKEKTFVITLRHLDGTPRLTLKDVTRYLVSDDGRLVATVVSPRKKRFIVQITDVEKGTTKAVSDTLPFVSALAFSRQGDRLAFIESRDTVASGSKHCSISMYKRGELRAHILVGADNGQAVRKGWGLTQNSRVTFSRDGKLLMTGLQPLVAPDDTTKYSFEKAEPNIWRWDALETPPIIKANRGRYGRQTLPVTIQQNGTLTAVANDLYEQVVMPTTGHTALSISRKDVTLQSQWDWQSPLTLSIVDLLTGSHKTIATAIADNATLAPDGRRAAWFDLKAQAWMMYDVKTARTTNLTEGVKAVFHDETDDHPMLPEAYGRAAWTSDGAIIVPSRFALWMLQPGKARRLTATADSDSINYRYVSLKDNYEDMPSLSANDAMLITAYNERTKMNGYMLSSLAKGFYKPTMTPCTYSGFKRAHDANVLLYKKGDFRRPMDLYVAGRQLTAINPWQKDYRWGTAELFHWTAYDGTPLDGIVYRPDGFDPAKKYPVMMYFYERRSDNLYRYYSPAPSRSTVNIPLFVSKGYVVFVPDIVYRPGHPGESAYNCVVSGARALAQLPGIDSTRMAIQGQSWGGYQVAYLITRTNLFRAAGAGAPVSNMTSAYGGIRWESGMSRQFQYEQSQSRIGKDLWSGYDLYVENSPLFKLPNVTTPVLITHNNADGAVPYYQGIEMFMGLRRLGKPAWLIEYNKEAHNLRQRKNMQDLSRRLSEFFDYYLLNAPEPEWMKPSTPYVIDGQKVTRQ